MIPILEEVKEKFFATVNEHGLWDGAVQVTIGTLSAKQAIGSVSRQDFALLEGREVMIEAHFKGSLGHAFTDRPQKFKGTISDVQDLSLDTASNSAIFISTLNAVTAQLGIVTGVRHCRNDEPEKCGSQIAHNLLRRFGRIKVGLIGFQPAILENLTQSFGIQAVRCSDLNPRNIGSHKFGLEICDGKTQNMELLKWSDLLLVTSSAIVNNTFDDIHQESVSQGKHLVLYGVTGGGVSTLLKLERMCPFGH